MRDASVLGRLAQQWAMACGARGRMGCVRGAPVVCESVCGFLMSVREETGGFLRRRFLARRRFFHRFLFGVVDRR